MKKFGTGMRTITRRENKTINIVQNSKRVSNNFILFHRERERDGNKMVTLKSIKTYYCANITADFF